MHFRSVLLVASIALAMALAGCQSSGPSAGDGKSVSMKNAQFVPKSITVKVGHNVTWTNNDGFNHDVTPKGSTDAWNPGGKGAVTPKATFTKTFTEAGTFEYYCQEHGTSMSGTVVVEA